MIGSFTIISTGLRKKDIQNNPNIIKSGSTWENVHSCDFKNGWGIIQPKEFYGNMWYGWTWNPGVTRLDF